MIVPNESKVFIWAGNKLEFTPKDYLLDNSINGDNVIIMKKSAIDKIIAFFNLEIVPYEQANTTILPNTIIYNRTALPSVVEHAVVKGCIGDKTVVIDGIGEANISTVSRDFSGYIGTMARKRAVSNAVVSFFNRFLLTSGKFDEIYNNFTFYSQDEWKNAKNDFTITPVSATSTNKENKAVKQNEPENKTSESAETISAEKSVKDETFVISQGKHKGKTIAEVNQSDPGYLAWVLEKKSDSSQYADFVAEIRKFNGEK